MTVRAVWYIFFFIWWQFERCGIFCFTFDDSSNGELCFVFHFMTVRTVWYILFFHLIRFRTVFFFFWSQFERCAIFCFSFHDSSNGVLYFVSYLIIFRTVCYILFFILWQFELCGIHCFSFYYCSNGVVYLVFLFYDSSNGVVYFVFHFMTVRTVWYILFFIWWQFELCGIFCLSFYDSSNGVVYLFFIL